MKNELQGEDLNLRPPHDECGELTNCSTLRYGRACQSVWHALCDELEKSASQRVWQIVKPKCSIIVKPQRPEVNHH